MAENEEIVGWDEAISSGNFVKFEKDPATKEYKDKVLKLVNWELVKCEKFGDKNAVEFRADVIEEDGEVKEKTFTTVSNRLKTKLKNILSEKDPKIPITITILPIGEDFSRQYSVKVVKAE